MSRGNIWYLGIFFTFAVLNAQVAELVDALDSKSSSFGSVGSIPTLSTLKPKNNSWVFFVNYIKRLKKSQS